MPFEYNPLIHKIKKEKEVEPMPLYQEIYYPIIEKEAQEEKNEEQTVIIIEIF